MKGSILTNQSDRYVFLEILDRIDHVLPFGNIRLRTVKLQTLADYISEVLLLHGERCFVKCLHIQILENVGCRYITEECDLIP